MFNDTKSVYRHLCDDKSRFLYEKRCMWSLSGDDRYIDDIIGSLIYKEKADEMMKKAAAVSEKLVVRGIGNEYGTLKRFYPDLKFQCFVDRDPVKVAMGTIDGHKVISLEEFYSDHRDDYIVVTSSAFFENILNELKANGIPDDHIFNFGALAQSPEQYFEQGIVSPVAHEIFVDGGCYDGTTLRNFARWCGNSHEKIYSFEPDGHNYELTLKSLEADPVKGVTLLNKGLWDKDEVLYFNESGGQGSGITDSSEGTVSIETTSIDKTVNGDPVTFIKLDVEGAEFEALKGAEETIRKFHPRMAISIYHKSEDIFTLPELVLSMSDEYRFYLRHYQLSRFETILYAV